MFDYTSSKEEYNKLADQVWKELDTYGLSKTPHIFELWLHHLSGKSPQLSLVLNQMKKDKDSITDTVCANLYDEYINSANNEQKVLEQTSERIQKSISAVQAMLEEAQNNASLYGGSLKDVSTQLGQADSIESLQKIVTTIVQETKQMVATNQKLEKKLNASSEQVSELRSTLENVKKEAMTDGLTGIANRKCFDREINNAMMAAEAENQKLCLLIIDIDFFKKFNDTFGHQVGDHVLKLVASALVNGIKGQDLAARMGGEEFAILLPETPLTAAVKVANNLRERIAQKEIINRTSNESMGRITISCGVAEYQPGEEIEEFIKRADDALYSAKKNGRNRVESAHNPYINIHSSV